MENNNAAASASLVIARIVYGINWFNIAAVFPLIAADLCQDVSLLGAISAAFLVGVGTFQIPSGIFAAKYGLRTTTISGIAVSSAAALATGLVSEAYQLTWLRFAVGLGMAFFFSSGVVLIANYSAGRNNNKSAGFSIGIMNSAHSVGGIIGIFTWIVVAAAVGWRASLVLSGAIGLATALLLAATIPRAGALRQALGMSDVIRVLTSRPLVSLGLVLTGIQASWAITLTFLVIYLQGLGTSLEQAGIIASLSLVSAIVSAPLVGRIYDRKVQDARKILLACAIGITAGMAAMASASIIAVTAAVIAIGFSAGGAFTVAYARARKVPVTNNRQGSVIMHHGSGALNVAWVNGLSLLGILWMPVVFSYAVKNAGGYAFAWLLSAALAALFAMIPLSRIGR
ncbi:MAG: MFS transporter [Nitrososphaera sp.]|jgi:MFS family permease